MAQKRYDVSVVGEFEGKDGKKVAKWTRIGVAFPFGEGKDGFTILLDAAPLGTNKLVMQPFKPKEEKGEGGF